MKGETVMINGDPWTVVDVAPAAPLAEMVAVILEDEGFVTMIRGGIDLLSDALTHLGVGSDQTTLVLVPEADADRAMTVIAETVTDYEGEELDELLDAMARGEVPAGFEAGDADDEDDHDDG